MLYLITFIILFFHDLQILKPVLDQEVMMTGSLQREMDMIDNPSVKDFNDHTKFEFYIKSNNLWDALTCQDMEAILYTQLENIPLDCEEDLLH